MTLSQKLWSLLTLTHRRAAVVLLGLMMVGVALETLGIGLVIPAITKVRILRWVEARTIVSEASA